jgi:CheY-like chemotaxis protein
MTDTITTILVAEDNDFVRMQIVKYLQDAGHKTLEANDGHSALLIAQNDKIDMAVVDVRMEPVDGFEFIRSIRGLDMQIPVILVTGDNSPDILEKAGDYSVSAMLVKPVEKERLVKAVERSLARVVRKMNP